MTGRGKKAPAVRKKANGYKMPAAIPSGEVLTDVATKKKWRIGPSVGVGGFGEIYSACEHNGSPKKTSQYPYVVKIEPHENGPLFVEKNFYMRNASQDDITKFMKSKKMSSLGMPTYFGCGSHQYGGEKYRYLVLERFGRDVWSLFKEAGQVFKASTVFQLGIQMLEVLEYIHSRGYVHADIKGANILMGLRKGSEQQAYLLDFGLAARVSDKEFKPDPKCAHNGTIEYTSRDAHLGVATMRGDLEILGYNMLQWLCGQLPWDKALKQPKTVQDMKEDFMKRVRSTVTAKYPAVPDALIKYFEYINTLKPKGTPDYAKCRQLFETYLRSEGVTRNSKLDFAPVKKAKATKSKSVKDDSSDDGSDDTDQPTPKKKSPHAKKTRKATKKEDCENEQPSDTEPVKKVVTRRLLKRISTEPVIVTKVKKTRLSKPTPPAKRNHTNTATQTSTEKVKQSPRTVTFDSPISEIIGQRKGKKDVDSSGDIFEDSFVIEKKTRKRLISDEEFTVEKIVKKRVVTTKPKKSWRNAATIVNGKAPPVS